MTSLVDSLGLLVGSVVVLTIVYLVGRLIGGTRLPWLGPVLAVAAVLSGPFWLSTAFDRFGVTEHAVVVRRSESIRRTWNGGFDRRFSLDLKYPRSDESFPVRVDQRHFDQVVFGDPVTVVALQIRKSFARLESMSSREWLAVVMPWGVLVVIGTLAAFAAGLALYGGSGTVGTIRKTAALFLLLGAGWTCYRDNTPYGGSEIPAAPTLAGEARVRAVHRVTHVGSSTRSRGWGLAAPYQLVELEFTPRGFRGSVVAVDAIDDASIPYLAPSQSLAITYSPATPRIARLRPGSRRFEVDNRSVFRTYSLLAVLVVGGTVLLGWLAGRNRR